jgi:hypothetical protein
MEWTPYLHEQFGVPVTVDNDVNLMALGEASLDMADIPLLFIKVAAGIGAGIVTAASDAAALHRIRQAPCTASVRRPPISARWSPC